MTAFSPAARQRLTALIKAAEAHQRRLAPQHGLWLHTHPSQRAGLDAGIVNDHNQYVSIAEAVAWARWEMRGIKR